jgi:cardiolipin synthase
MAVRAFVDRRDIRTTLLLPHEYVTDATRLIREAKRRVFFMCLIVEDDVATGDFIDALEDAARRGVKVDVAADAFTYGDVGGNFLPKFYRTKRNRESNRMARSLTDAGVRFTWLGMSRWRPLRGRTHIKFCVVDDVVYSFGGVNLYDRGVNNVDYMLKVRHAALADRLGKVYASLRMSSLKNRPHQSFSIAFGLCHVLVDAGRARDSIIYRKACSLAREAESIVLVSQYCPDGPLGRLIRRTPHDLYFNRPDNASGFNKALIRVGMLFSGNRTLYRRNRYLHAKCIIFTMGKGKKVAMTGSHNFSYGGVRLGTREIALVTEDPEIIHQLERFCDEHVRTTDTALTPETSNATGSNSALKQ